MFGIYSASRAPREKMRTALVTHTVTQSQSLVTGLPMARRELASSLLAICHRKPCGTSHLHSSNIVRLFLFTDDAPLARLVHRGRGRAQVRRGARRQGQCNVIKTCYNNALI